MDQNMLKKEVQNGTQILDYSVDPIYANTISSCQCASNTGLLLSHVDEWISCLYSEQWNRQYACTLHVILMYLSGDQVILYHSISAALQETVCEAD